MTGFDTLRVCNEAAAAGLPDCDASFTPNRAFKPGGVQTLSHRGSETVQGLRTFSRTSLQSLTFNSSSHL